MGREALGRDTDLQSPVTHWAAVESGLPLGSYATPAQAQGNLSRVGHSHQSSSHMLAALDPHCEGPMSAILTVLYKEIHIAYLIKDEHPIYFNLYDYTEFVIFKVEWITFEC